MTLASMYPDLDVIGARMGIDNVVFGAGVLIGTPIAGAILQASGGVPLGPQLLCGGTIAASAALWLAARMIRYGVSGRAV